MLDILCHDNENTYRGIYIVSHASFDEEAAVPVQIIWLGPEIMHRELKSVQSTNHIDINNCQSRLNRVGIWI
jgi:hypothetical protein